MIERVETVASCRVLQQCAHDWQEPPPRVRFRSIEEFIAARASTRELPRWPRSAPSTPSGITEGGAVAIERAVRPAGELFEEEAMAASSEGRVTELALEPSRRRQSAKRFEGPKSGWGDKWGPGLRHSTPEMRFNGLRERAGERDSPLPASAPCPLQPMSLTERLWRITRARA